MSVLFLPPSAGAASIPDASETVKGKIRIATSAEATAGTDDLTSMTPLKVKSVVDAAVVGGVTYQGTFDASSPADLSNASKGDLYIISVAGSYQGQDWAVGDHLLINADMGGTLDPNKIDKVDNTDSVTSVAGRTGAVVLSASDVSGLATVATSGAYSDLSGTPSLATVATTGAYSDLTGAPTLGTAAAEDVGTGAGNVVQLNGSAQLPAVDGSLLTNISATVAALDDVGDVTITTPANTQVIKYNSTSGDWENGAVAYSEVTGKPSFATIATTGDYSDLNDSVVLQQFNATATASAISSNALHVFRFYGAGGFTLTLSTATVANGFALFNNVSASDVTINGAQFRSNGEYNTGSSSIIVKSGERRLYYLEGISTYMEVNSTLIGHNADVNISSPANGEALIYNSTSGDWENGTVSASVAALNDVGDVTITTPANTQVIKYNSTSGDWENGAVAYADVSGTPSLATVATTGAYSDLSGTPTLATVATTGAYSDLSGLPTLGTAAALDVGTSATNVVQLDGSARLPAVDGSQLTNLPSGASTLGALTDVTITSVANTQVIKYNSTSGDWENGAVAYADVSGTPTLGTAAALDVGTSANNVVQLNGSAQLPAVDGSQLTGISASVAALNDIGDVSAASPSDDDLLAYNSTSGDWETRAQATNTVVSTTTTAAAIDNKGVNTYSFISSSVTLTIPQATQLNGLAIFNNTASSTQQTISGSSVIFVVSGNTNVSSFTLEPGETRTFLVRAAGIFHEISADRLERQGDVNISSPANGEALIYNSTSGDWENGTVSATVAALNDIGDVSAAAPNNGDVIAYNSTSGDWEAAAQSVSAPSVTVSSPSADQTLSAPSGIEEAYIYTPSANITVNLVAAATCGSGFKYQIKNRSTNTITIDPNGSETVDGAASFALSIQEASVTLITDGSNWFII